MASYICETALAATQASISILLILLYGYLARRYRLVNAEGEANMSYLSVHIFLPALLVTQIGSQISAKKALEWWPFMVLAPAFIALSALFGWIGVKLFSLPGWVLPAATFPNVTSLHLLLTESLAATNMFEQLAQSGESTQDALARAQSYLLFNALIHNVARFAFGPWMIKKGAKDDGDSDVESEHSDADPEAQPDERSRFVDRLDRAVNPEKGLQSRFRSVWESIKAGMNAPLCAGLLAIVLGCIPPLNYVFFDDNGPLKPSLTQSIKKIGGLYTALQMFVLGAQLQSHPSTFVSALALSYLFLIRFVVIPALSITTVYFLSSHWQDDPIFNFVLMLGPTGPPAITLAAIVEMASVSKEEDGRVARMLAWSYAVTPAISGTVVSALWVAKKLGG